VLPAASTSIPTWTCRSAAPPRRRLREPDAGRQAFGGTTTIVDFAIQYRGQTLHAPGKRGEKKPRAKRIVDYGFHMIITS